MNLIALLAVDNEVTSFFSVQLLCLQFHPSHLDASAGNVVCRTHYFYTDERYLVKMNIQNCHTGGGKWGDIVEEFKGVGGRLKWEESTSFSLV